MVDYVARDDQSLASASRSKPEAGERRSGATQRGPRAGPPRSDIGTIILHWATAVAFFVSIFTGVRIAADDPDAFVSKWLEPILPQGEGWTWHFFAGLALKNVRAFFVPRAGKLRYDALNVVLHWLVYVVVVVLTTTGILLYLGYGGWLITVHLAAAFTGIAYTLGHLLSHYLYGGLQQWLRLFRPSALI